MYQAAFQRVSISKHFADIARVQKGLYALVQAILFPSLQHGTLAGISELRLQLIRPDIRVRLKGPSMHNSHLRRHNVSLSVKCQSTKLPSQRRNLSLLHGRNNARQLRQDRLLVLGRQRRELAVEVRAGLVLRHHPAEIRLVHVLQVERLGRRPGKDGGHDGFQAGALDGLPREQRAGDVVLHAVGLVEAVGAQVAQAHDHGVEPVGWRGGGSTGLGAWEGLCECWEDEVDFEDEVVEGVGVLGVECQGRYGFGLVLIE